MAEINLGAVDRCMQTEPQETETLLASEGGGYRYWGSDGGKKLMTCWVGIERDTSFQLETLKTSLFRNC